MTRTAKLFRNGRSQAVRLPAEFRFQGKEVDIRRDPVSGEVILSQISNRHETFKDFLDLADRLRARDPEQFEGFLEERGLRSSKTDPFE